MPSADDVRLGQLIVAHGLVPKERVDECLAGVERLEKAGEAARLGDQLVGAGLLTQEQVAKFEAQVHEAPRKVTRVGHYDLVRKLGEGGMGAVYMARNTENNEIVALKVLPRSKARDEQFLRRFEGEARATFELDHPNIVRGLDVGHADGYHFLVMEFVDGYDVFTLLEKKGRLSEPEALHILVQMAAALQHIQGENLVHRDIKPENILICKRTGQAKLTDLGLAIDRDMQGRRRITQTGVAMGTPYYLSPEQVRGSHEIDLRSDIYSLGATVYEMVTGHPPFDGEPAGAVLMKHLSETVASPHDMDRGISLSFCQILEKMMAKEAWERYQTATDLLGDLGRLRAGQPLEGVRPTAGRSTIARPKDFQDTGGPPQPAPPADPAPPAPAGPQVAPAPPPQAASSLQGGAAASPVTPPAAGAAHAVTAPSPRPAGSANSPAAPGMHAGASARRAAAPAGRPGISASRTGSVGPTGGRTGASQAALALLAPPGRSGRQVSSGSIPTAAGLKTRWVLLAVAALGLVVAILVLVWRLFR